MKGRELISPKLNKPLLKCSNVFLKTAEQNETLWTYDRQAGAKGKYIIEL